MKKLRSLAIVCAMMLALTACASPAPANQQSGSTPEAAGASTAAPATLGGYVESELPMPSGYDSYTAPANAADGKVYIAAKKGEQWDLLCWTDIKMNPSVTALKVEGGDISSIAVSPEGSIAALVSEPIQRPGGAATGGTGGNAASGPAGGVTIQVAPGGDMPGGGNAAPGGGGPAPAGGGTVVGGALPGGMSMNNMTSTVAWYKPDGTAEESFEIKGMTRGIVALDGKRVAVQGMQSGVDVYGTDGKVSATWGGGQGQTVAFNPANPGSIYILSNGGVEAISTKDGAVTRAVDARGVGNATVVAAPDGTLYFGTSSGITKLGPSDTEMVKVSDVTSYLIGDPTNSIQGACATANDVLIIQITEGQGGFGGGGMAFRIGGGGSSAESSKLLAYTYNPALDLSNRTEFTITALRNSSKLRKAVSEFQRAHPELNVKLNALMAGNYNQGGNQDAQDYVRMLNTDLLAGKGSDVIILDGLPIENYIAKGVLADLTADLAGIDFLPGIYQGSKAKDGKIYAMPAQFSFETLWGKAAEIGGVDSLDKLVNAPVNAGQTLMYARTPEQWLRLFYPASEAAFRDEKGALNFASQTFQDFLTDLNMLYTSQSEVPESQQQGNRGGGNNRQEMQALLNGAVMLYPATVNGTMQVPMTYMVSGGTESGWVVTPSVQGEGKAYNPTLIGGVNAKTKNRAMATEFIRTLFSPAVQELEQMEGLPTVGVSLDKLIADAVERGESGQFMMAMRVGDNTIQAVQPDKAAWDAIRAACDKLDTPFISDTTLLNFIIEETLPFFEGKKSAADAAKSLQQRANSYLSE